MLLTFSGIRMCAAPLHSSHVEHSTTSVVVVVNVVVGVVVGSMVDVVVVVTVVVVTVVVGSGVVVGSSPSAAVPQPTP